METKWISYPNTLFRIILMYISTEIIYGPEKNMNKSSGVLYRNIHKNTFQRKFCDLCYNKHTQVLDLLQKITYRYSEIISPQKVL